MSGLLKTQIQLGDSNTATQNFTLTSAAADGTMKLSRGNFGATTQDILTIDASGNVAIPLCPTLAKSGANTDITSLTGVSTINGTSPKHWNDIINGQFRVAQAGTSFPAAADSSYCLDGWLLRNIVTTAVVTLAQSVGDIAGKLCLTKTVTTADSSVTSTKFSSLITLIEGYNCVKYIGNTFTVGFRVRSSVTGIHCFGVSNGSNIYTTEYTINVANTWEYKTVTIIGGTPSIASSTNSVGLTLSFCNMSGSSYQTGAINSWSGTQFGSINQVNDLATIGNVFALEDVTMNLGTTVSVDDISFEDELRRCMRYYQKSFPYAIAPAYGVGNSSGAISFRAQRSGVSNNSVFQNFTVPFRISPNMVAYYSTVSANSTWRDYSSGADSGAGTYDSINEFSITHRCDQLSGTLANNLLMIHWVASARL